MKPYIHFIAYPRTGSNWVEYITKTIGKDVFSMNKTHTNTIDWWKTINNKENLLMILRNYKECIPRHTGFRTFNQIEIDLRGNIPIETGIENSDYMAIIKCFDSWKGPKYLIYYEDLITNPENEIRKLVNYFKSLGIDIDNNKLNDFLNNIDHHKNQSISNYERDISKSLTKGNHSIYYSSRIKKIELEKIDDYLLQKYPDLTKRYLKRYL